MDDKLPHTPVEKLTLCEVQRLKYLKQVYEFSERICDPLTYIQRKKDLLHVVVEFLLEYLKEHEESQKDKTLMPNSLEEFLTSSE